MNELFVLAGRQLVRKKLRVVLVLLGIAIGVAAVIGVTSLGEGIRVQAVEQIKASHDLTTIEVSAGTQEGGGVTLITESKTEAIKTEEYVLVVAPFVKDSYVTGNNTYLAVKGITPEYRQIHGHNLQLERGEWFVGSGDHNELVLGYDVAKRLSLIEDVGIGDEFVARLRLYGEEGHPIDKTTTFKVVGILKSGGDEHDNQAFIGMEQAKELDEKEAYDGLWVKVDDPAFASSARAKIEGLGLNARSAQDMIDEVNRLMVAITLVLGFFSGISLVVGALMVANTMIISVYERTKEIGLSKALGASDLDIIKMFLAECAIIGMIGGIFGDVLGIGFSMLIDKLGKPFLVTALGGEVGAGLQSGSITVITPTILIAGFAISVVLSIVSGLYPARRASKLNPLDALRQI